MSKTVFIADTHLDESSPEKIKLFLSYIALLKSQNIDALHILGDFFEYWIGDDNKTKISTDISNSLKSLANSGCEIFFIHGNRDFLLGDDYAKQCSMQILDEQKKITVYNKEYLIMHGDTLCTDDTDYMEFRNNVRTAQWKSNILRLPLFLRKLKAKSMRRKSRKSNKNKNNEVMDINQISLEKKMLAYDVCRVIHGHTHRQKIHSFTLKGSDCYRYVLGDWGKIGSALEITKDNAKLIEIDYYSNLLNLEKLNFK